MEMNLPECVKCDKGVLLPLSDYGRDGAPITYKAWVCNNPTCGFNLRIDNGEISFGRPVQPSSKGRLRPAAEWAPTPEPRLDPRDRLRSR